MIKLLGAALGIVSLLSGKVSAGEGDSQKGTLYFFFSERTASAPAVAQAVTKFTREHPDQIILRPALLVEDWSLLRKVTEESPLFQTVRQLGIQIQVYDEDALRLATAWKIVRLPAVALVIGGRAHVVQGATADLESLWRCAQ